MRILCLASGRGTNFRAVVQACRQGQIPDAMVVGLITNKIDSGAIEIAQCESIPCVILPSNHYRKDNKLDRAAYDTKLTEIAQTFKPDWICLLGYRLILGSPFIETFQGKVINIHPSLLPNFPGLHAQRQALLAGVPWTGCTVHIVNHTVDGGPILAQTKVPVLPHDTEESLSKRILEAEHRTIVQVLKILAQKELKK